MQTSWDAPRSNSNIINHGDVSSACQGKQRAGAAQQEWVAQTLPASGFPRDGLGGHSQPPRAGSMGSAGAGGVWESLGGRGGALPGLKGTLLVCGHGLVALGAPYVWGTHHLPPEHFPAMSINLWEPTFAQTQMRNIACSFSLLLLQTSCLGRNREQQTQKPHQKKSYLAQSRGLVWLLELRFLFKLLGPAP